ncbi:MAG: NAD-dependent epimerase/dehydratase family protein, partial [Patescibacteria group bacterium]|nr:NAD-dependent epimerase/dehydratase family protein [Patescibacteria group bacterium]
MKNKQRIIIIGGGGFIGSNLVEKLFLDKKYNIIVLDKNQYKNKKVKSYFGDYSDGDLLNKIIKQDDIIFHLAGASIPAKAEYNISEEINNDVIKTIKLLEICGKKQIKKFIFVSSGGMVYGKYFKPVSEKNITDPISFHGVIKLTIEKYVRLLSQRYNFPYIILRPANLYGRIENVDRPQGAIDIFLRKAMKKEIIEIWGNGKMIRDYIFIDDVVNFLEKLLKSNINNEV